MATGTKRRATQSLSKFPLDLPSGSLQMFAGTTAPSGWIMCDGSAISRTTYAALFAVVGTTYGVGDGSTTFNLPDLRGEFVRGLDDMGTGAGARGVDSGRGLGTAQSDDTSPNGMTYSGTTTTTGSTHSHSINTIRASGTNGGGWYEVFDKSENIILDSSTTDSTDGTGTHTHTYSGSVTGGGAETRPRNVAMNYIIKL